MFHVKKSYRFIGLCFRLLALIGRGISRIHHQIIYSVLANRLAHLGEAVIFDKDVAISHPQNVSIGSSTFIGRNTIMIAKGGIDIGSGVGIAAGCRLITWNHDINNRMLKLRDTLRPSAPIIIKDGVWLGYNTVVLPGVTMERGSVAAAGAVVTRDVQEFTIVGGVPAKTIGIRKDVL